MMIHAKRTLLYLLASCAEVIPLHCVQAQSPTITLVVPNFDFPGSAATVAFGINSHGDIAGWTIQGRNTEIGYVRFSDGTFSAPIQDPDGPGRFTAAEGINRAGVVAGFYYTGPSGYQGYTMTGSTFQTITFGTNASTFLFGINDGGDVAGVYLPKGSTTTGFAFAKIGGTDLDLAVPGQTSSEAHGINNRGQVVGDYSTDGGSVTHGFVRQANGSLTYPIDFPGAVNTYINGINDKGWMVGRYTLADNKNHGFFLILPNTFVGFDYSATLSGTTLNGINSSGLISGNYQGSNSLVHGFTAQVSR